MADGESKNSRGGQELPRSRTGDRPDAVLRTRLPRELTGIALANDSSPMSAPEILPANRDALLHHPTVLEAVMPAALPEDYEVWQAEDREATVRVGAVPLHHATQPRRDGRRWAAEARARLERVGAERALVVGFGFGHHVEALCELFDGEIHVLEPDPSLLRLALCSRDVSRTLARVRLQVGSEVGDATADGACVLAYAPLLLLPGGRYGATAQNAERAVSRSYGRIRTLVVTPMYGGSHPMAVNAHRALLHLGHDAHLLDLAEFLPAYRQLAVFDAKPSRRALTEGLFCQALGDGVAARVEEGGFDLVLALAQAPLAPPALEAIRRAGAISALWFVEDRRVFPYWREVAPYYDHVFAIQQGECLSDLRAAGARHAAYLPCAADPSIHRPLRLTERERTLYGSDLSFVGAGYRNRRYGLRRFLDMDFRLWGSDWEAAGELEGVIERGGERISSEDAVRIWNATAVNLNLHSSTYCDDVEPRGDFVNPRTFELAASGAFQLVDRRSLLPELFEVGTELVTVDSVAEMKDAAVHYLARPREREAIAGAARRRVLRDHTYERRMEDLIQTVVSCRPEFFAKRRRAWTVGHARSAATGLLAEYLEQFPADTPFTLDEMVRRIPDAEGPLEDAESLLLFLDQFDDLYLAEHRR